MDFNLIGVTTTHRIYDNKISLHFVQLVKAIKFCWREKYFYSNPAAQVVQLGLILTMTTATYSPNWTT